MIILGAITETYFGTTLGKKIFRIKVLDDEGNYPNFFKSLKRNLLCLTNLFPIFSEYTSKTAAMGRQSGMQMNFRMYLNNKFCTTYIVKESKIAEIKSLLNIEQHKENERLID